MWAWKDFIVRKGKNGEVILAEGGYAMKNVKECLGTVLLPSGMGLEPEDGAGVILPWCLLCEFTFYSISSGEASHVSERGIDRIKCPVENSSDPRMRHLGGEE